MDWDRAEKRGHDLSMTYSLMIDGQMLHFVYIISPKQVERFLIADLHSDTRDNR